MDSVRSPHEPQDRTSDKLKRLAIFNDKSADKTSPDKTFGMTQTKKDKIVVIKSTTLPHASTAPAVLIGMSHRVDVKDILSNRTLDSNIRSLDMLLSFMGHALYAKLRSDFGKTRSCRPCLASTLDVCTTSDSCPTLIPD